MVTEGINALANQNDVEAIRLFEEAHQLEPDAIEPVRYLSMLKRANDEQFISSEIVEVSVSSSDVDNQRAETVLNAIDNFQNAKVLKPVVIAQPVISSTINKQPVASSARVDLVYGTAKNEKAVIDVVSISDLVKLNPLKPVVRIAFKHSIILESKNIKRFLVIDPLTIQVQQVSRDRVQVDANQHGSTFLHVWDDTGRTTIYVEVILPIITSEELANSLAPVEHAEPFRLKYSNDWSTYYTGPQAINMKRQNASFYEQIGMEGQTPYGNVDASASLTGFNPVKSIPTYTVGLQKIPVPGTSDFNVRLFDALKGQSLLTAPLTYLRGQFLDVNLFKDAVGLSVTNGQLRPIFGGFSTLASTELKSYVKGFRMVLFPKDKENYLAFNYAQSYGADRNPAVAKSAYSIEGMRTIDKTTLNAELARNDASRTALLSGIKWKRDGFQTALNVRDVNRDYATVLGPGLSQGEIGALWTTETEWEKLKFSSVIDMYRNRAYFNPENPDAYNFDTSVNARVPINQRNMVDTSVRYVDSPQELSPRRSSMVTTRLVHNLDVWNGRIGSVYTGIVRQRARYASSPLSEFDRTSAITGLQLPLLAGLSYNANYEYSWLKDTVSGLQSNPNVFYTGLSYYDNFNEKTSGNFSLTYRKEQNFKSNNSFLAGEDSMSFSTGFNYHPNNDVNYFIDGRLRRVWPLVEGNASYNDMDIHAGMRMNWGMPLTWDPQGIVSGILFKDFNGDGIRTANEKGIAGVQIKVGNKVVETDASGKFQCSVHARKVLVTPVFETLPTGYVFSTPTSYRIEIRQGQVQSADFGLTTRSGVYGIAFRDKNGNGAPDQGDEFVSKVRVILDGKVKLLTDSRGVYFFRDVAEGKHTVSLDMKEMPLKYIPLIKIKSDINVPEGTTYTLHIPLRLSDSKPAE
ncbi:MAG: pilus assembly protein N-terminal domain-containing protein [Candidatus Omnitrophota bacterium]